MGIANKIFSLQNLSLPNLYLNNIWRQMSNYLPNNNNNTFIVKYLSAASSKNGNIVE